MVWDDAKRNPPPNYFGWELKIKEAGLHLKWPEQLKEIHDQWEKKLPKIRLQLAKEQFERTDTKIIKNIDGTFEQVDRTEQRNDFITDYQRRINRGESVIELCKKAELAFIALEQKGQVFDTPKQYKRDGSRLDVSNETMPVPTWVKRNPIGTTYYIDSDSGSDAAAGTATGTAWQTLAQYTTTSVRSAGDIAILRNGTTATYGSGSLNFDEDGTINDNIFIKRDLTNAFGDDVSITPTATFEIGSKTVEFSSDVSAQISAGDSIYQDDDDPEHYLYEVASVSTSTVTLYLPYLGENEGTGKSVTNIGSAPVFGSTTANDAFNIQTDNYWNISGLHLKTNNSGGAVLYGNGTGLFFKDTVFESGSNSFTEWFITNSECSEVYFNKCRAYNFRYGMNLQDDNITGEAKNCLFDGNSKSGSFGLFLDGSNLYAYDQCEFKNHATGDIGLFPETTGYIFRNCKLSSTVKVSLSQNRARKLYMEDYNGTPGKTAIIVGEDGAADTIGWESDTTTVRTGGSNTSIKVTPTTQLGEWTLINHRVQLDTSATTITLYVKTDDTTEWTANPTADELEVAIEYWGHATNDERRVAKSTDTANFTGSTDWQGIGVTVTPGQSGLATLTMKYKKPKESGKTNPIFVCQKPDFS